MTNAIERALIVLIAASVGGAAAATDSESLGASKQASGYLDVGGSQIYYEERGSGPAMVLLHDGLLHAGSWDELWEPLAARHRVIRYDRRGYGRSGPAMALFSPTEDLVKLLRHLKVQRAMVVGSSTGAALAIDFAIAHPELIDGLFLIGPVLHGLEFSGEFRERANRNNAPMEYDEVKAWARNWSQDRFLIAGANEGARRKIYQQLVANAEKLKKYDDALEGKISPPASQRLSEIKVPSVILVGEADIADVHTHAAAINAGIRGSELVAAKGAGHLVQLEKPREVVAQLEDFAKGCARN